MEIYADPPSQPKNIGDSHARHIEDKQLWKDVVLASISNANVDVYQAISNADHVTKMFSTRYNKGI